MPDETCSTCTHFGASRIPGKAGLCALDDVLVYPESTCERHERLPFSDEPEEE